MIPSFLPAQTQQDSLVGKLDNPSNRLPAQVQKAFDQMHDAALEDGINLSIVSGYRSYDRQQSIWNRKYNRYKKAGLTIDEIFNKIVEYSTVPGTSRHHWGTDLDIIDTNATYSGDVLVPAKFHGDGPFCKMKVWMEKNASQFGFELVYTDNSNRTGFKYEPWHYSYVPLSRKRYQQYITTIDLKDFLRSQGILGMNLISDKRLEQYFKEHIQGINPLLR
jgi:LAS superfamily LD-carboxypeptidase LdcB